MAPVSTTMASPGLRSAGVPPPAGRKSPPEASRGVWSGEPRAAGRGRACEAEGSAPPPWARPPSGAPCLPSVGGVVPQTTLDSRTGEQKPRFLPEDSEPMKQRNPPQRREGSPPFTPTAPPHPPLQLRTPCPVSWRPSPRLSRLGAKGSHWPPGTACEGGLCPVPWPHRRSTPVPGHQPWLPPFLPSKGRRRWPRRQHLFLCFLLV